MSYLKSNMGMLKYFMLTFQTHGHFVPTFFYTLCLLSGCQILFASIFKSRTFTILGTQPASPYTISTL